MRATVILYSVTAGLPTLWQTVTKSPSRSQGGQGAGPSIFGTATRQSSHVTSHPGRMSNQPSVRNLFPKELDKLSNVIKDRRARLGSMRGKNDHKKSSSDNEQRGGFSGWRLAVSVVRRILCPS